MMQLTSSYGYLIAAIAAFVIAQIIKTSLLYQKQRQFAVSHLFSSGNMPSGHTATMIALIVCMWLHSGMTDLLAAVIVIAILTVYDSMVARRSVGEQGTALLRLLQQSRFAKDPMPRVALGHKPYEILAGAVLGAIVGGIVAIFITN